MPTQTPEQRAAAFQGAGLNYAQQGAATQGVQLSPTFSPITAPLPTMDASKLAGNTTGSSFVFPTTPPDAGATATTANNLNSSIPTADSIISQESAITPAEQKNQGLLNKLATAIGSKTSLATLKTDAENAAGAPQLAKTLNDLNSQLEGLTNQSLALQNDAGNYGAIQNKERLAESGGNIEAAMHGRPLTRDALLQNQIQQSAIASQALTLKSAIYAANGSLALAKDAADKAAQAQFDREEQEINYQTALIAANKPQMDKEEKAQAALLEAKLADRQTQIENAKEDKKTAIALAAAAMKNNPSDPAAQYAAQQALAESNRPQPDLEKIFALVGKYQQDPLDIQQKILQLQATRANIAQSYASADASRASAAASRNTAANGKPSTQAEKNDLGFYNRALDAEKTIGTVEDKIGTDIGSQAFLASAPNLMQPKENQIYRQAQRQFTEARLRKESGAAIPDSEYEKDAQTYFKQTGDTPETTARKVAARQAVLQSLAFSAGNAYREYYGEKPGGAATTTNTVTTASGKPFDKAAAIAAGYTEDDVKKYLASH